MNDVWRKLLVSGCAVVCYGKSSIAQQTTAPQSSINPSTPPLQVQVTVHAAVDPMTISEAARSFSVFDVNASTLLDNSIDDLLRQDTSLNLQARAGDGVQADISIRGTTFEQSLVLVNGFRVNDPESGHLNLDIPVPLDAIGQVDVLHGAGSTFFGSDAIGGAVNLVTERPAHRFVLAEAGFGSYGSEEQHLITGWTGQRGAEELAGERDTSDGFMADRGYHVNVLSSETWLDWLPHDQVPGGANQSGERAYTNPLDHSNRWTTDILLGASDRPYGANQFYGPYDSWERTKGWFASVQQELGAASLAEFAWRRHTDLFVLLNGDPGFYSNNHNDSSWEGALRGANSVHRGFLLSAGLEADGDSIHSSNLGTHARNQGAGYLSVAVQPEGRLTANVGAREEVFSGGTAVFSPSVAASYLLGRTLRVRGSAGHGFRLPTYTDLYYSDPATKGNPLLKPESAWSYEAGLDWLRGTRWLVTATGFELRQIDSIDYSKYSFAAKWQARNISNLNLSGAEAGVEFHASKRQTFRLGYTGVLAAAPPADLLSEYAYNYAAQNALFAWTGNLPHGWSAATDVNVVQRTQHAGYPLWNGSITRTTGRLRPYLRLLNLSNTGYEELVGVRMQGRTIMAGAAFWWSGDAR